MHSWISVRQFETSLAQSVSVQAAAQTLLVSLAQRFIRCSVKNNLFNAYLLFAILLLPFLIMFIVVIGFAFRGVKGMLRVRR